MGQVFIVDKISEMVKKRFFRNVVTVASGAATAQLISMIYSPFITRIYGPEAFGILGTFVSILTIATTIAALTYPIAIVLPQKDYEAKKLVKLSFVISLVMSVLALIILLFFGDALTRLLKIEILMPYIFFIPIIMFFSAGRQAIEQWLIRKKQFKITAKVSVIQSLILNNSKTGFGLILPSSAILILVTVLGYGLHMFMLMIKARPTYLEEKNNEKLQLNSNTSTLISLAKNYKDFPLYRSPQVLLASITQSMPVLMLTSLFGPAAAGFYTIGITVLGLPSQLIGKAFGDVFYPRISEAAQKKENLTNLLLRATITLAAIGFIPFSVIIIFGPPLFSFVFGQEWATAGNYASWIALWSYALFISNPSIKILPVLSAQKFHLIFTIFNITIRGGALLVGGIYFESDITGVALFSISGALLSITLIILTIIKCRNYEFSVNI
jgi:O-antigen/teichoic acid export membrane protein